MSERKKIILIKYFLNFALIQGRDDIAALRQVEMVKKINSTDSQNAIQSSTNVRIIKIIFIITFPIEVLLSYRW